jgi:POTRA domain TamA domain 1
MRATLTNNGSAKYGAGARSREGPGGAPVRLLLPAMLPAASRTARHSGRGRARHRAIEGLSGDLEQAARSNLTLQQYVGRDVTPVQVRRFYAMAADEIRSALEPFGYYNASVDAELKTTGDQFNAIFRVNPGPQVVVRDERIQVSGEAGDHPVVKAASRRFRPRPGDPLNHAQYEQSIEK